MILARPTARTARVIGSTVGRPRRHATQAAAPAREIAAEVSTPPMTTGRTCPERGSTIARRGAGSGKATTAPIAS